MRASRTATRIARRTRTRASRAGRRAGAPTTARCACPRLAREPSRLVRRRNSFDRKEHLMRQNQLVFTIAIMGTAALGVGCVAHAQAGGYAEADAPVAFV